MSNNIEGKVVVITGASSGLGEANAQHRLMPHSPLAIKSWMTDYNEVHPPGSDTAP